MVAVKSNETGNYSIGQLLEGKYNVRAEAAGFKAFVEKEITLGSKCPKETRHFCTRRRSGVSSPMNSFE